MNTNSTQIINEGRELMDKFKDASKELPNDVGRKLRSFINVLNLKKSQIEREIEEVKERLYPTPPKPVIPARLCELVIDVDSFVKLIDDQREVNEQGFIGWSAPSGGECDGSFVELKWQSQDGSDATVQINVPLKKEAAHEDREHIIKVVGVCTFHGIPYTIRE